MVLLSMGASDMKTYLLKIIVFFGIIVAVDITAGKLFWYLQSSKAGGRTEAEYYVCKLSHDDVIIMGSSRASHHYIPQILTDSLGFSCFNAGQDGNGIIMQYGRWRMISERYRPKIIIYDLTHSFDLEENDNMAYIDHLKPFCSDKRVMDFVAELFPKERIKMASQLYRYNYKFLEIISDCLKPKGGKPNGYIPLIGMIKAEAVSRAKDNQEASIERRFDENKIRYLERLAHECQIADVKLMFVVSPYYAGGNLSADSFRPAMDIAAKYDARFYYFNDDKHYWRTEDFKDTYHLNDDGAKDFTKEIVNCIVKDSVFRSIAIN